MLWHSIDRVLLPSRAARKEGARFACPAKAPWKCAVEHGVTSTSKELTGIYLEKGDIKTYRHRIKGI